MSPSLSPFVLWPALPTPDYYGDSVTMGLAPVRPSRVPFGVERIECDLGVPFIPLNEIVSPSPCQSEVAARKTERVTPGSAAFETL